MMLVSSHPAVPQVKALALLRHPDGDRILVGDSDPDGRHPQGVLLAPEGILPFVNRATPYRE